MTFCNIYACDVCDLLNVYLPTAWWNESALENWKKGHKISRNTDNWGFVDADGLFDWLEKFGDAFGWMKVFDANTAQDEANSGKVVVISAKKLYSSGRGHISVVVPEGELNRTMDHQGNTIPVQTQAGAKNYRMSTQMGAWWRSQSFRDFKFWAAPIGAPAP